MLLYQGPRHYNVPNIPLVLLQTASTTSLSVNNVSIGGNTDEARRQAVVHVAIRSDDFKFTSTKEYIMSDEQ